MLVIFLNNRRQTHQSWTLNSALIFSETKEIAFAKKKKPLKKGVWTSIHTSLCPSSARRAGLTIYVGTLLLPTSHGLQPRVHADVMASTL